MVVISLMNTLLRSTVVFVASLITGPCVFGLVAVPLMLLLMVPRDVVQIIMIIILVLDTMISYEARRYVEWRKIVYLMGARA